MKLPRFLRLWRHGPERTQGTRAREKAERDLEAVRSETPKYRALAASLVEIQRANHLGANAARILRGEK